MEAIAKTRHLKGSPRKARLVIDLIRGRNVSQALNILKFTDKRAADPIAKTLRSAIANATYLAEKQNIAIDPDDLFVKTCFVDMGAHKNRRRMRPAPQGRAFREQRHYCHITILVSSDAPADTKSARKSMQTSGEKGDGGARGKDAPKPEAIKKTKKTSKVKETKTASAEKTPKVKETKKAQAEKPAAEEKVETASLIIETPAETTTAAVSETPIVSDPIAEMMDTKETPKAEETIEAKADEPKVEEPKEAKTEKVAEESEATETAKPVEAKPKKPTQMKTAKASEEDTDILEVESPKAVKDSKAAKDDAKADAKASDAKNVQSQTPVERNETKKADDAQLDENDILELQ